MSICGELAGDPLAAVLLLAMGFNSLSMNATSLPRVKKAVRNLTLAAAREVLQDVMELEDPGAVLQRLEAVLSSHGMEQFLHAPVD